MNTAVVAVWQQEPPLLLLIRWNGRPAGGTRFDSISYYTQGRLAAHSHTLFRMQQKKAAIAASGYIISNEGSSNQGGGDGVSADSWLELVVKEALDVADQIMDDSVLDNALVSPVNNYYDSNKNNDDAKNPLAEGTITSTYGSITTSPPPPASPSHL